MGLIAFTAIYNFPRYGLKQNPPFDILNQAGYLLVFVSHVFGEAMQCSSRALKFSRFCSENRDLTVLPGRPPHRYPP